MSNSNQYFFHVDNLKALISTYGNPDSGSVYKAPPPDYHFKGLVFVPGYDEDGHDICYAFPVFCPIGKTIKDSGVLPVIIHQNTSNPGCPYPPPCDPHLEGDGGCYSK